MKRILATTALVALTASAAFAESHVKAEDGKAMEATASTEMKAKASMEPMADVNGMSINASDLIGKRVYVRGEDNAEAEIGDSIAEPDADWDDVGEIGDVIISKDGKIQSVVLDAGGFLGLGEKEVSTSMDELKFVREEGDDADDYFVVYTGNRAALEEQDELDRETTRGEGWTFYGDRENHAEMKDGEMKEGEEVKTVAVTEQADPEMEKAENAVDMEKAEETAEDMNEEKEEMAEEAAEEAEENKAKVVGDDTGAIDPERSNFMTADGLDGLRVFDGTGEDIGEISDLVIDMDGKITAVIVDVGGFLGIGEKPVALSFDKVEIGRNENGTLVASTAYTEEEMEAADSWDY